ncbi:hypothetical protein NY406_10925 [Chlorobaculum sp. MV4-Y]|uniref:hypothetical protein n=1 Tax=Chlorobaculum sp. MV4-Y TaxID=2976335 RepID=UPI0021AE6869|nr:hypothetical protein [Chlorobaculum sp. MV4-Y]UWX57682.1 hypothetical protein NY406_10925 [Chlorobaculum sp. MV4-Y]
MPDFRPYVYLGIMILVLLMSFGCTAKKEVKIKSGGVEITIPQEEIDKSKALNKKLMRGMGKQDLTKRGVTLPDIETK